ncbi:UNVERIFIED_CONTAM: hypothetical protein Sradi_6882300 [Sesamum radiatum]|uniref:Uncharacterized protein n=1 Tax=Sesamum radiatum TaxID=300843 RepID=A0AAW2JIM5_SESRA
MRQNVRRRNLFSYSINDCGHNFLEHSLISKRIGGYLCHVMTGDGSSLHRWTLTALDKAYDDYVCDTVTSLTGPRYRHRKHVTIVVPQV